MTREQKREAMDNANAAGLSVNGVAVQVSGVAHDFATVTVRSGHPLAGFSTQYGWHVIDHAARFGYKLRN